MAEAAGSLATWMENLPEHLHSKPLNSLAIPGSHDSFTSFLDCNGGIAPSAPPVAKKCEWMGKVAANVVCSWSQTQDTSLGDQLKAGIRYFDFRIAANAKKDNVLCFCHGLYGKTVEEGLCEVDEFIQNHPKEIVFLDFNHFYEMDETAHHVFVAVLESKFGSRLCPVQPMSQVTLENLWGNKQQVLVFYHEANIAKEFPFLWLNSSITSPWPKTTDVQKLVGILDKNFEEGRDKSKFYVTQGVLTPDDNYILKNAMWGSIKFMSRAVVAKLLNWLEEKYSGPSGINICIIDFATGNQFIPTVIGLNQKYVDN